MKTYKERHEAEKDREEGETIIYSSRKEAFYIVPIEDREDEFEIFEKDEPTERDKITSISELNKELSLRTPAMMPDVEFLILKNGEVFSRGFYDKNDNEKYFEEK